MLIWREDTGGEIGKIKIEEESPREITGPYTIAKEAESGMEKEKVEYVIDGT